MYTSVHNPDLNFKEVVRLSAIILSNEKRSLFGHELSYKKFKVLSSWQWLAVTSDDNPAYTLRKLCRQKENVSFLQDIMYVSVRYFFQKCEGIFLKPNTFLINNLFHQICSVYLQTLTTALSIENGSLFEGENQSLLTILQVVWMRCC